MDSRHSSIGKDVMSATIGRKEAGKAVTQAPDASVK